MNVNEKQIEAYLRIFHSTYKLTVESFIDAKYRAKLDRYSHLSPYIIGYVSTNSGAGYEYVSSGEVDIRVVRGSRPIEDVFFNAPLSVRRTGPIMNFGDGALDCVVSKLTLEGAFPLRMNGSASVTLIEIAARVDDWYRPVEFAQLTTDRSTDYWSEQNAITRAKDEVLQAQIDLKFAQDQSVTLGEYLKTFKERHVLVLGDFTPTGRERLRIISEHLNNADYIPILLDQVPEFPEYDLRQKLNAVASVCRFTIVDDSSRGGQLAELMEIDSLRVTALVLRLEGSTSSYVVRPLSTTSRVIREASYTPTSLSEVLNTGLAWAEDVVGRNAEQNTATYPWRQEVSGDERN